MMFWLPMWDVESVVGLGESKAGSIRGPQLEGQTHIVFSCCFVNFNIVLKNKFNNKFKKNCLNCFEFYLDNPGIAISIRDIERFPIIRNCDWCRLAKMWVIRSRFKLKKQVESCLYLRRLARTCSVLHILWFQERSTVSCLFLRMVQTWTLVA